MTTRLNCSKFKIGTLIALCLSLCIAGHTRAQAPASKSLPLKSVAKLGGFSDWVTSVAWSSDGKLIATGSYEKLVLWDGKSFKQVKQIKAKLGRFRSLQFSKDNAHLYAGGFRKIGIYDSKTGELTKELAGHKAYVTALSLSPDGKQLASSSEDATVRLWNLETGESKIFMQEEEDPVMGVAFSHDGKLIATASGDDTRPTQPGLIKLWNATNGEFIKEFEKHLRVATGVTFSPDDSKLASTSQDEIVYIHDVKSGKLVQFYEEHGRPTNAVRFMPSGNELISIAGGRAVGKNEIHVWSIKTGKTIAKAEDHKGPVLAVAISADGKHIVSASRDNTAAVWSLAGIEKATKKKPNLLAGLINKTDAALKGLGKPDEDKKPDVATLDDAKKGDTPKDEPKKTDAKVLKIGMIGLDTSHCLAFTKLLNVKDSKDHIPGCRMIAVYPKGSPDIVSSTSRVPKYTEEIKKFDVKIVNTIEELVSQVDAVLLETNDGRPHLEQIIPVLKAGKPVFIDKPIAGSLADAIAIFELSRHYKTPVFSSSSLRFASGPQAIRNGSLGEVTGCSAYSPCSLEKTHPDLFWYGIHGVELLFTVMGPGCDVVSRASSADFDAVMGIWKDGRIGTFRGIRKGSGGYGGFAFGTKGSSPLGSYEGYRPMLVEIVKFFNTKKVPVEEAETLDIYAFMEAADESKRQGGNAVKIADVMKKARKEAAAKIEVILAADKTAK
jgi:WD40 repeat protein/predicted dehydrogenase